MADIKESRNNSQVKLIATLVVLSIVVSAVTSFIVVKALVPNVPMSTSFQGDSPAVQPPIISDTAQLRVPEIEANLLQNNGFENGLSGWEFTNNQAGITVFETTGINGKAYCSRRFLFGTETDLLNQELVGFAQEIPLDPAYSYFFSAWVKLYNDTDALAQGLTYYESKPRITWNLNLPPQPENTTKDWFYIESYLDAPVASGGLPTWTSILIGLWHRSIQKATSEGVVDSTFCVDDVVFGKIVK